jgi:hypothetical protein
MTKNQVSALLGLVGAIVLTLSAFGLIPLDVATAISAALGGLAIPRVGAEPKKEQTDDPL